MEKNRELGSIVRGMAPADLRLYYPGGDQRRFWQGVLSHPAYRSALREIEEEGVRLSQDSIPQLTYGLFALYERQGTRLEYERVYFERRRRMNTFALLSLLHPEREDYLTSLHDILWAICDEYTWCLPAHVDASSAEKIRGTIDLFSAETGFALSEIRLLLGDMLPPLLHSRIADEVNERLFEPFLDHMHGWETATHNWSAVCAGSVGSAALLLVPDSDRLTQILKRTEASMACYLQGFGADGACLEGLGYWNYGFGYFVYYADLLRKRSRGAIDWLREEKVSQIALFQHKCFLGGGAVANFSDSQPEAAVQTGLSDYLAGIYEAFESPPLSLSAGYREDHCSRWAPALRNLIWRDPGRTGQEWGAADYYLEDAQWLISRVASGHERYGFAAKGGRNDEPHNHNDLGHFILYGAGEVWCSDLGCGEYTADYFGEGRYGYDCNGSQGHSVPVINGRGQSEGPDSEAIVLEASLETEEDRLRLDLTKAYREPELLGLTRTMIWNKRGPMPGLTVIDEYRFIRPPDSLLERIVTRVKPDIRLVDGEHAVVLGGSNGKSGLVIRYDEGRLTAAVQARMYRDHYGKEALWYAVDFEVKQPEAVMALAFEFQFIEVKIGEGE